MADSGVSRLLITLVTSLLISSLLISWFLLNIYGVSVAGIQLPQNTDIGKIHSNNQNFSSDKIDYEVINVEGIWTYYAGVGRVLTQLGYNGYSYLLIDKIQPNIDGDRDNTYYINNSAINMLGKHGEYSIILRYTGGIDQNELIFSNTGITIPTYLINAYWKSGSKYFYAYPDINQISNPKIRTVYDDTDLSLTVYMDDVLLFTTTSLNTNQNLFGVWGRHYGGVGSFTLGFTLFNFYTPNDIVDTGTTTGQDVLGHIAQVLSVIIQVTTFQINPAYIPLEWSIILIGTQEAGILICAAIIIRG